MAPDRFVAVAIDEDALTVGDLASHPARLSDGLGTTVAHRQYREHLGLNDLLPEAAEFLVTGDGEEFSASVLHRVDTACDQIRCVNSVGIGELKDLALS